ncbi:hypothetical protein Gorai_024350 [Gossypium raimondii]|uniref:Zinc knuckle CX2CX4HX4C domain-containing protein n=1 Tax=Gossypium raimondii TaxID=29730 RepID=A0A7J8NYW1_GOSRA|nr:hypothetical protein [Gossypium raimondii]
MSVMVGLKERDIQKRIWLAFKYENLPTFCFGCGKMGQGMKKCEGIPHGDREKGEDKLPYSITLKGSFEIIDQVVVDKGESLVGLANPLEGKPQIPKKSSKKRLRQVVMSDKYNGVVDAGKRKVGLYESNEMTSGEFVGNLNKKIKYDGKATNGMVLGNSRLVSSGYESTHSYFGSVAANRLLDREQ